MGCAASSIEKDENVQRCKERKRLMKQLVVCRGEFAEAQLAYLRALRNTGVTLRQFAESESLELENTSYGVALAPSPPPTLPPSPPPPPPFSPDLRKPENCQKNGVINEEEESIEIDGNDDGGDVTPPPPMPSSTWEFWDPFESLDPADCHPNDSNVIEQTKMKFIGTIEQAEEEDWAETKSEFEEEDEEQEAEGNGVVDVNMQHIAVVRGIAVHKRHQKVQQREFMDNNSSTTSRYAKDAENMPLVDSRIRKSLERIIRELDEYFLKASGCEKGMAVFMNISGRDTTGSPRYKEIKRKRSSSAKVFSALSWSWSSKSLQLARDATESSSVEPCRPGAHCTTLEKLYAAEKKLYEQVRSKEMAKMEHESKRALLQKQEEENYEWSKMEKTRLSVESLESDIRRLEHSISTTCSCLQKLMDEELYPQLVAITSGLTHMWKTKHRCHRVQAYISQQLDHLSDCPSMDLSSEYKRQAAAQLENEVTCWYNSFCKLIKCQQEYVRTLYQWIRLTHYIVSEDSQRSSFSAAARKLCEEWKCVFERLPDKVASEAIRSFLLAIQSIIRQQAEEYSLQRKSCKLERRLQKELNSLAEIERKLEGKLAIEEASNSANLSSRHPLSIKQAKTEALRKRLDIEKAKYLNSVEVSKSMTLNNLKSSLPNVFQALTAFADAFGRGFEAVQGHIGPDVYDASQDCHESEAEETSHSSEV